MTEAFRLQIVAGDRRIAGDRGAVAVVPAPGQVPGHTSGQALGQVPGHTSGQAPGHVPGDTSGRTPSPAPTPTPNPTPTPTPNLACGEPEPLWREVLGAQLRELRRRQGETLVETAARAGISPQYLSEVERGLKEPSSEMIAAVAGALGTTLGGLVESVAEELRMRRESSRLLTASLASRQNLAARPWRSGPVAMALAA